MVPVDKMAFLQHVSLFAGMTAHELVQVTALLQETRYPPETTVIREQDAGDCMFIVADGEVTVHRGDVEIRRLRSKDFFGEMSLLDREPRSASVTTISNCLLLRLDQRDFWRLLIEHNTLGISMVKVLTQRLRQVTARL